MSIVRRRGARAGVIDILCAVARRACRCDRYPLCGGAARVPVDILCAVARHE